MSGELRGCRGRPRRGLGEALIDRLRLDGARLGRMAAQIEALAELPDVEELAGSRALGGGLMAWERRRPVGVIGANYEARPNVTVDIASQFSSRATAGCSGPGRRRSARPVPSRRRGRPRMQGRPRSGRRPARPLARPGGRPRAGGPPRLIPLVILRGSGRPPPLARHAAGHGVERWPTPTAAGCLRRPAADPRALGLWAQPRPAGGLQPAQPAAGRPGPVGRGATAVPRGARGPGHRALPAAAPAPPRARMGAGRRQRGARDDRHGGGPGARGPARQRADVRDRGRDRHRRRRCGAAFVAPTPVRAPSGTPPRGCSTGSSSSARRRPASTWTTCPAHADPSPTATCISASTSVLPEGAGHPRRPAGPGVGAGDGRTGAIPLGRPRRLAMVQRPAARAGLVNGAHAHLHLHSTRDSAPAPARRGIRLTPVKVLFAA